MNGKINVKVEAKRTPRGHVECLIHCNGQRATVTFTGREVITEVHEDEESTGQ